MVNVSAVFAVVVFYLTVYR